MSIILISPADLEELISASLRKVLAETTLSTSQTAKPLSIDEAATYLGVPKNTLYQLTSSRGIPHQKLGRRLTFLTHQLDDWILSRKRRTRQKIEEDAVTYKRKESKK